MEIDAQGLVWWTNPLLALGIVGLALAFLAASWYERPLRRAEGWGAAAHRRPRPGWLARVPAVAVSRPRVRSAVTGTRRQAACLALGRFSSMRGLRAGVRRAQGGRAHFFASFHVPDRAAAHPGAGGVRPSD